MDNYDHIVATTKQWNLASFKEKIIPRGTLCIELFDPDTTKIKIGVGNLHFRDLPYIGGDVNLSNYYTKNEVDNLLANLSYMRIASNTIYGDKEALPKKDNKQGDVRFVKNKTGTTNNPDLWLWDGTKWIPMSTAGDNHTHNNKTILDAITAPYTIEEKEKLKSLHNYDDRPVYKRIDEVEDKLHFHDNKDVLDKTTAPFTIPDKEKLDSLHPYDPFVGTDGRTDGTEGLVPAPTKDEAGMWLGSDGEWHAINEFIGATPLTDGERGLVPKPTAEDVNSYLRGDGTWAPVEAGYEIIAGDGINIEDTILPGETDIKKKITNTGVIDITQEDPDNGNILTIHTSEEDKQIIIPTGSVYTEVFDSHVFSLLHECPEDWEHCWFHYFKMRYVELTEKPTNFDPTRHYKYTGDTYIVGDPGESWDGPIWYEKRYTNLDDQIFTPFSVDVYYAGEMLTLVDGETLLDSFSKINENLQRLEGRINTKVGARMDSAEDEDLVLFK